jgi:DNA-binding NarL/FixJ family response regulator
MSKTVKRTTEPVPDDEITNVWLIEDNESYRLATNMVLNKTAGLACTGVFGSCEQALDTLKAEFAPDVILLDVGLPGMSGIEGLSKLKALAPTTHMIILTAFDDQEKIFRAVCAGASGYLLKSSSPQRIAEAIREVQAGGAPMSPRIARCVLDSFAKTRLPQQDYGLTVREKQILDLAVQGLIKKEIADKLSLSYHTINAHLRNIYSKLQVQTRASAVAKAINERLL